MIASPNIDTEPLAALAALSSFFHLLRILCLPLGAVKQHSIDPGSLLALWDVVDPGHGKTSFDPRERYREG